MLYCFGSKGGNEPGEIYKKNRLKGGINSKNKIFTALSFTTCLGGDDVCFPKSKKDGMKLAEKEYVKSGAPEGSTDE